MTSKDQQHHELEQYKKIIEFHDHIVSGDHPKISLAPDQLAGMTLIEPQTSPKKRVLTLQDAIKLLQPSQTAPPTTFGPLSEAPLSSGKSKTFRLEYTRDYYHELCVSCQATKNDIQNAFQALPADPRLREAFEILSDDYLRHIYDDARAVMFVVASGR